MKEKTELQKNCMSKELKLQKVIEFSRTFLAAEETSVNYMEICRMMAELSEVRFVAFNTYDKSTASFRTEALHAGDRVKQMVFRFLGLKIEGQRWPMGDNKSLIMDDESIRAFDYLYELSSVSLPQNRVKRIQRFLQIRKVMIVRVSAKEEILGDFTIFLDKQSPDPDPDILNTFAGQVGLYLKKASVERELLESRRKFDSLVQSTQVGTWEWHVQSGEVLRNERWAQMLGYRLDELGPMINQAWKDLLHPADVAESQELLQKVFRREIPFYSMECRVMHKQGHYVWVLDQGEVTEWAADGSPLVMFGSHTDISGNKILTEAMRKSQQHYQLLVDSSYDIIYRLSPDGIITYLSNAWEKLLGIPVRECVGKMYFDFAHPDDQDLLTELKNRLFTSQERQSLKAYRLRDSKGAWLYFDTNVTPLKNSSGQIIGFAGTARDVTAQIKWQNQIEFWSFRDPLTNLYNRRYLEDALHRLDTERNLPFSVATLDVDKLKQANDTYGHRVGDQLLIKVAEQLRQVCRKEDILCRIGGDEFVVLLPKTSAKTASEIQARIQEKTQSIRVENARVSVSIGCATKTEANQDMIALLHLSDRIMYREKNRNRRRR
jgi:diguanylate cyclase (GGDEF)-like protein/PAS domain S-box-containing protein